MLIGGIEAGGTKFNCAVYNNRSGKVERRTRIETTGPEETMGRVFNWFDSVENDLGKLKALGLGVFGPLDLDCNSITFGSIKITSKVGWSNVNIIQQLSDRFGVPIGFNTDVNAAAFGEAFFGDNQDLEMLLYITIGTGVGVSAMYRGEALFNQSHLEAGHMLLPELHYKNLRGSCKFHGNCWEGFCSGKAIEARTNLCPSDIPGDHVVWEEMIEHTSIAIYNMMLSLCPDKVILGGGVTNMGLGGRDLFFQKLLKGVELYNSRYSTKSLNSNTIQPPSLGDKSGIYGAFYIGDQAYIQSNFSKARYFLINGKE